MIIFGSTGLTSTIGDGVFACPRCSSQQSYKHKQVKTFFTLYFIPLIPMGVRGSYVECSSCGGTYDEQVLSYDPAAAEQEFFSDLKRLLVLLMIADGTVDDAEIAALQNAYRRYGGGELSRDEIAHEAAMARNARANALGYLQRIAGDLGDAGREIIIKAAFHVVSATGQMGESQKAQLGQFPAVLGISQEQFKAYIAEAAEEQ